MDGGPNSGQCEQRKSTSCGYSDDKCSELAPCEKKHEEQAGEYLHRRSKAPQNRGDQHPVPCEGNGSQKNEEPNNRLDISAIDQELKRKSQEKCRPDRDLRKLLGSSAPDAQRKEAGDEKEA